MLEDNLVHIAVSHIKRMEGFRSKAYLCPAGVWTIGYGTTGKFVVPGLVWTREQAEEHLIARVLILFQLVSVLCPGVTGLTKVGIVSFCDNLGVTKFKGSTLKRKILAADIPRARIEMMRWVYGGGIKLPGLIHRRSLEARMLREEDL
jgi:GH24 family phage-related lysozyme (muramidase)